MLIENNYVEKSIIKKMVNKNSIKMKYIISLIFLVLSFSIMAQESTSEIEDLVRKKIELFESTKETYHLNHAIQDISNTQDLNINEYRKLYFKVLNVIQEFSIEDFDRKNCQIVFRSIMIAFAPEDSIGRARHEESERLYEEKAAVCRLQSGLDKYEKMIIRLLRISGRHIQSQTEINTFFRLAKSSLLYPERLDFLRKDFQKNLLKNNSQK